MYVPSLSQYHQCYYFQWLVCLNLPFKHSRKIYRAQRKKIKHEREGKWCGEVQGVPQGSVLGPVLCQWHTIICKCYTITSRPPFSINWLPSWKPWRSCNLVLIKRNSKFFKLSDFCSVWLEMYANYVLVQHSTTVHNFASFLICLLPFSPTLAFTIGNWAKKKVPCYQHGLL